VLRGAIADAGGIIASLRSTASEGPKAVVWASERDRCNQDALLIIAASGAANPCQHAGGSGVAAARRGKLKLHSLAAISTWQ
jgi:hypothetical protein